MLRGETQTCIIGTAGGAYRRCHKNVHSNQSISAPSANCDRAQRSISDATATVYRGLQALLGAKYPDILHYAL